jgi:hypothetical protein
MQKMPKKEKTQMSMAQEMWEGTLTNDKTWWLGTNNDKKGGNKLATCRRFQIGASATIATVTMTFENSK